VEPYSCGCLIRAGLEQVINQLAVVVRMPFGGVVAKILVGLEGTQVHDAVEVIGKNFVANQFDRGSVKSDIGPIIDCFFYMVGVLAFRGTNQGG
jgi:hypothetical protein